MSFSNNNSKNILTVMSVMIQPIRILMCSLKDILLETNITFTKEGIKIINMDKSHTILAHVFLEAVNFEMYECKMDKIIIGVNMFHLFKLINTIDNDDTLTMYIEELDVPDVKFSSIINLPSVDFQKIIRDLSCISDKIEIKSIATAEGAELIFRCSGGFANAEIRRAESDGNMEFIKKQELSKIIQGEFSLKNLGYFIKCTNLCSQIEMYLENDLPLVVKYNVASLGAIKLMLAALPSS